MDKTSFKSPKYVKIRIINMTIPTWVSIKEASKLVNTCDKTIRRWVIRHKDNANCVEYRKGVYYVNTEMLNKDYNFIQSLRQSIDASNSKMNTKYTNMDTCVDIESKGYNDEKFALMTLSKQSQDISNILLNKPLHRLPVFWVSIGFVILILAMISIGYLYRTEIIANYQNQLNNKNVTITKIEKELQSTKQRYQEILTEIKSSYQKLTFEQEKQINKLSKKLEAAETEIAFKSKNISQETDVGLSVNYLGKGADTERGIQ